MPAPDFKAIVQYEFAILTAWRAILKNAGIPEEQIFVEFLNKANSTPRVELNVVAIKPTGHKGECKPGQFTFDAWDAQLVTRVHTRRVANAAAHYDFLARARTEALYFNNRFTAVLLPWHCMTQIQEQSSHPMIDRDQDEDITELTHKIVFSVRAGAWPTPT